MYKTSHTTTSTSRIKAFRPRSGRKIGRDTLRTANDAVGRHISPQSIEQREAIYRLVDIIDYLFDEIVEVK